MPASLPMGANGMWIIDLDGVAFDLSIRDLRKLISSTMADLYRWDVYWVREMIRAYHEANAIDALVEDRAYFKIERLDRFVEQHQLFVIRMKDNIELHQKKSLKRLSSTSSSVQADFTCQLGTKQCRSTKRHRVVIFRDANGRDIRVVTNLFHASAETIADMYQQRWTVEVFFRWVKQYLNVPTLFGTTENAVYNQLFAAFIAYVLLRWLYDQTKKQTNVPLSFISFAVFSLGSFLSIGNSGWPLLCLSMPKFMEGVCIILDNQHSWFALYLYVTTNDEYVHEAKYMTNLSFFVFFPHTNGANQQMFWLLRPRLNFHIAFSFFLLQKRCFTQILQSVIYDILLLYNMISLFFLFVLIKKMSMFDFCHIPFLKFFIK